MCVPCERLHRWVSVWVYRQAQLVDITMKIPRPLTLPDMAKLTLQVAPAPYTLHTDAAWASVKGAVSCGHVYILQAAGLWPSATLAVQRRGEDVGKAALLRQKT